VEGEIAVSTRGRKPGFIMSDEHRTKISNSKILNRLVAFAEGDESVQMDSTRASVAMGLLNKVMPNLQATDLSAEVNTNITGARWLTEAELQSSHIAQEASSDHSTTESSDGLASWPTDGQAKQ
jgi:hypothetical protein